MSLPAEEVPSEEHPISTSEDEDDGDSTPRELSELQKEVANNPTFKAHAALVQAARSSFNLEALRLARMSFHLAYPLPPSQWQEWLDDESRLASTLAEKENLLSLYDRAVRDYLCIDLHLKRLTLAMELYNDTTTAKRVEDIFANSATCGATAHFTRGVQLCETYASFLRRHFKEEQVDALMAPHWKVPLRGRTEVELEGAREACEVFEARLEKARTKVGPGLGGAELLMQYRSYAEYCKGVNEQSTRSVYERCVAECFLKKKAWMDYILYCKEKGGVFRVCQRAIQNVPWALDVWTYAVLALRGGVEDETGRSEVEVLKEMVEKMRVHVMGSRDLRGAQRLTCVVWETFDRWERPAELKDVVYSTLEFNVVGTVSWAVAVTFAAKIVKKRGEEWRELMEKVVKMRGMEARWWVSYGKMGGEVLERGIKRVREVGILVDEWVEHVGGDLEEIYALERVREGAWERRKAEVRERIERGEGRERWLPKKKRTRGDKGNAKVDDMKDEVKDTSVKKDENMGQDGDRMETEQTVEKNEKSGGVPQTAARGAEGVEPRTIFVNNLPFSVTEDDLREHFTGCGTVVQIRLQRRSDGASKGRAYIEFSDEGGVDSAVQKHQQPLKGRGIWIRRSRPTVKKGKKPSERAGQSRVGQSRMGQRRQHIRIEKREEEKRGDDGPKTQEEIRAMVLD